MIDYLVNFCRPLVFSTAASPLTIAAAAAGVETIRTQPELRERLGGLAQWVKTSLGLGSGVDEELPIPIIPVPLGTNDRALEVSRQAEAVGLLIPAIRPPTVPEGTARLRISLSAAHSDEQIAELIAFLRTVPECGR